MADDGVKGHQQKQSEQCARRSGRPGNRHHRRDGQRQPRPEEGGGTQHRIGRFFKCEPDAVKRDARRYPKPTQRDHAVSFILRDQGRRQQREPVTDGERNEDMRRDEEWFVQLQGLPVGGGIEHFDEERAEHEIERHHSQQPRPLSLLESPEKEEWHQPDAEIHEIEFFDRASHQEPPALFRIGGYPGNGLLGDVAARSGGGMDFLILPARESVNEPTNRAGIAPVQRRIRHRSQRHVNVEGEPHHE